MKITSKPNPLHPFLLILISVFTVQSQTAYFDFPDAYYKDVLHADLPVRPVTNFIRYPGLYNASEPSISLGYVHSHPQSIYTCRNSNTKQGNRGYYFRGFSAVLDKQRNYRRSDYKIEVAGWTTISEHPLLRGVSANCGWHTNQNGNQEHMFSVDSLYGEIQSLLNIGQKYYLQTRVGLGRFMVKAEQNQSAASYMNEDRTTSYPLILSASIIDRKGKKLSLGIKRMKIAENVVFHNREHRRSDTNSVESVYISYSDYFSVNHPIFQIFAGFETELSKNHERNLRSYDYSSYITEKKPSYSGILKLPLVIDIHLFGSLYSMIRITPRVDFEYTDKNACELDKTIDFVRLGLRSRTGRKVRLFLEPSFDNSAFLSRVEVRWLL